MESSERLFARHSAKRLDNLVAARQKTPYPSRVKVKVKGQRQTVLVELAYEGSAFHGLAPQPGLRTVASTLQQLLEAQLHLPAHGLVFAARTDAGVSALQNYATVWFRAPRDITPELPGLAAVNLPELQIQSACSVSRSVNARTFGASKHYRYRVCTTSNGTPRSWGLEAALDVERMQAAARYLLGVHDFSAFRAANCQAKTTQKHLTRADVSRQGDCVQIDVEGNSFLRRMMRIVSGTLVEVGTGARPPEAIRELLLHGDRERAGVTAPAHGLELVSIRFQAPEGSVRRENSELALRPIVAGHVD